MRRAASTSASVCSSSSSGAPASSKRVGGGSACMWAPKDVHSVMEVVRRASRAVWRVRGKAAGSEMVAAAAWRRCRKESARGRASVMREESRSGLAGRCDLRSAGRLKFWFSQGALSSPKKRLVGGRAEALPRTSTKDMMLRRMSSAWAGSSRGGGSTVISS